MSGSTIGIKLADGSFYPILPDEDIGKKKLVLTTVKDNQESVQIDLFRGTGPDLENALYIGSLVLDNLVPKGKGESEIELIVGVDSEGILTAKAGDDETGEHQSLSVGLDSLSSDSYEIPEFEMSDSPGADVVREEPEEEAVSYSEETFNEQEEEPSQEYYPEEEKPRKKRGALLWLALVLGLLALVIAGLLIFRSCGTEKAVAAPEESPVAAVPQEPAPEPKAPEPVPPKQEEPQVQAPPAAVEPPAAASEDPEGVWYKIKWGDTLWDISIAYYRTPWLYGKIAKINNIKNPDLIYAGNRLFIPKE